MAVKSKCIISVGTSKEKFVELVNRYFYSNAWTLTEDNKFYNTKTNKFLPETYTVVEKKIRKRTRWQLRLVLSKSA